MQVSSKSAWLLALVAEFALLAVAVQGGSPRDKGAKGASEMHSQCAPCHRTHSSPTRLALQRDADASVTCAACHQNKREASKYPGAVQIPEWRGQESSHLNTPNAGKPIEGTRYIREYQAAGKRRFLMAGCTGCHDPHAKDERKLRDAAFDARGQWMGSRPANSAQVCFGCHAGAGAAKISKRLDAFGDLGTKFMAGTASSHRIGRAAKDRPDLPSLNGTNFIQPLDCISCHDNSDPGGPRGPHISSFAHLLVAPYARESEVAFGDDANELCYRCHSRASIEADQSFPLHREHVQGFLNDPRKGLPRDGKKDNPERWTAGVRTSKDLLPGRARAFMPGLGQPASCATCHDPHGSERNPALIAFDPSVVTASAEGGILYQQMGPGKGSCTLVCHGYEHVHATY